MFFWLLACGPEVQQEEEACEQKIWYYDLDGDGFGGQNSFFSCEEESEAVLMTGDCDDGNQAINPNAAEGVADGIDQNCDGVIE